jgi:hypothetical protein
MEEIMSVDKFNELKENEKCDLIESLIDKLEHPSIGIAYGGGNYVDNDFWQKPWTDEEYAKVLENFMQKEEVSIYCKHIMNPNKYPLPSGYKHYEP